MADTTYSLGGSRDVCVVIRSSIAPDPLLPLRVLSSPVERVVSHESVGPADGVCGPVETNFQFLLCCAYSRPTRDSHVLP